MQCPKCHLENPPSTETCDCGYSFATRSYTKPVRSTGVGAARGRYAALERIAGACKVVSWIAGCSMVLAPAIVLANATEALRPYAIGLAVACLNAAALQWFIFRGIAEAIMLFVDIANDVRTIAAKAEAR